MAESKASASASDDVRTTIIYFILPILAGTALSPVGFVGIAVPMILYKLSRRVNWLFIYIALCAALFVVGVLLGSIPELRDPYSSVLNALASPHFDPAVLFDRWLRLAEFPAVWFALMPFGGVIGTVISLVEDDREQSQLAALTRGEVVAPLKRALLASWFQRRIDAKPARRGPNIVLGGDWRTGQAIEIPDADLNRHLLLAGTTGAGKTVGLINLIEGSPGIGTIIVDGKGDIELARRVMELAKSRGQKAFLIGGPDQNESAVYNPLNGNDFTSLADRIVTLREWTEPYYLALAKGFAQTAFKVLAACGQRVDLVALESRLSTSYLLGLVRKSRKKGADYQELANEITSHRNAEEQIEGLRAELRIFAGSALGPLFDTDRAAKERIPVITLARARKENAIVYFCLPALAYPQFANFLGKLIINDIKATASTATTPWRIILDEFSVFSGQQVLNLINMGRSHGISAVLATQSFADIAQGAERNGDKFLDQVIGSINTFLTYRLNAPRDCEIIAGISGTLEGVEFTAQTIDGVGTGAASARHTRTFRIHPDAVRNLAVGEAIYINKSRRPEARDNYVKVKSRHPSW